MEVPTSSMVALADLVASRNHFSADRPPMDLADSNNMDKQVPLAAAVVLVS